MLPAICGRPVRHDSVTGQHHVLDLDGVATGSNSNVIVVLDGARFPLKAAEHARRSGDGEAKTWAESLQEC